MASFWDQFLQGQASAGGAHATPAAQYPWLYQPQAPQTPAQVSQQAAAQTGSQGLAQSIAGSQQGASDAATPQAAAGGEYTQAPGGGYAPPVNGRSAPPPGQVTDPRGMFDPSKGGVTAPPGGSLPPYTPPAPKAPAGPPTGDVRDPLFARQLVDYWAGQPGSNPSLKNDPGYWVGKLTSGELGTDMSYITGRFMQQEGAPASGGPFDFANAHPVTVGTPQVSPTPATPQYQRYNFQPLNSPTYTPPQTISPDTIQQYRAPSSVPTPTAPGYTPGDISQYGGAEGLSTLQALAQQLANAVSTGYSPDVAGAKESTKDTLISQRDQALESARLNAAGRGTLGAGALQGQEADTRDAFAGDLTANYRDIDAQAARDAFNNALAAMTGIGNLGAQEATTSENEYQAQLAGQQTREQTAQAATSFGQNADAQKLQAAMALEQLKQAEASSGQSRGSLAAQLSQQQFADDLAGQQFQFDQQKAQADNQQSTNATNLSALLGLDSNSINRESLAQQFALAKAQLEQSGALGFGSLGLQQAGLEQNTTNGLLGLILSLLGGK